MSSTVMIALTMGDPAGIGPEIVVKLFASDGFFDPPQRVIVIGDEAAIRRELSSLDVDLTVHVISEPEHAEFKPLTMNLLATSHLSPAFQRGQVSAEAGLAAYSYVAKAVELTLQKRIGGICTAPINKEALRAAGLAYPGHTEILADLTHTEHYAMMLLAPQLRTILVTLHVSLLEAVQKISIERVLNTISVADRALRRMGIPQPRIAVAGLNPHAGEGGLFGREEIDVIQPAIALARNLNIDVSGPYPGDTVFLNARRGRFDIVVAQYHDQGLIPIKLLGFEDGVNVTAGLPIVRTSVDHGTAFDIAGRGIADASSLRAALKTAFDLVQLQQGTEQ